jgi:Domain of unknown function (DUF4260)
MKYTIKLEELAMTSVAIYLLSLHSLGLSWWVWIVLFFTPDISMLGYLFNTRVGALSYNIFHHKGIALVIVVLGMYLDMELLIAVGLLLFAHSCFDRIWGYGLKYPDNFKNTHLGAL